MRRPFSDIRPIGPLSDVANFSAAIGGRGSRPVSNEFDGMFESFTIVLEYNLTSSFLLEEDDLAEEGHRLEDVLNEYLFSTDSGPLYFMRGEVSDPGGAYSGRLLFGVDGDIWEGRLNREGKHEGSIGGTENVVNANLQLGNSEIGYASVDTSYMFVYPTEKAKEIQDTGSIDME